MCVSFSPSARQSASLFVQGLSEKVSVRSLAVLFCLSVYHPPAALAAASCRRVFPSWHGVAGESSPSCPQLLMHPAWLSQDEMGAIQPN